MANEVQSGILSGLVPTDSHMTRACLNKSADWSRRPWIHIHLWIGGSRLAAVTALFSAVKDTPLYILRGLASSGAALCNGEIKNSVVYLVCDTGNAILSLSLSVTLAAALPLSLLTGSKIFRLFESQGAKPKLDTKAAYVAEQVKNKALEKENTQLKGQVERLERNLGEKAQIEIQKCTEEQLKKIQFITKEIWTTEIAQVESLEATLEWLNQLLETNKSLSPLEKKVFEDMRTDIKKAIDLSAPLLADLANLVSKESYTSKETFALLAKHKAYYDVYTEKLYKYQLLYSTILNFHNSLEESWWLTQTKTPAFKEIENQFNQYAAKKHSKEQLWLCGFGSLLIKPTQRIGKIELLARELAKFSASDCSEELEMCKSLPTTMNENVREFEKGELGGYILLLMFEKYNDLWIVNSADHLREIFKNTQYMMSSSFDYAENLIPESQKNLWVTFRGKFEKLLVPQEHYILNIKGDNAEHTAALQLEALLVFFISKKGELTQEQINITTSVFDKCPDIKLKTFFHPIFDRYNIGDNKKYVAEFRNNFIGRMFKKQEQLIARTKKDEGLIKEAENNKAKFEDLLAGLDKIKIKDQTGLHLHKFKQRHKEVNNGFNKIIAAANPIAVH